MAAFEIIKGGFARKNYCGDITSCNNKLCFDSEIERLLVAESMNQ